MSRSPRYYLAFVFLLIGAVLLVYLMAALLRVRLLDFENYLSATRILWQRQNPYGEIEFFAPPWLALILSPLIKLPIEVSSSIWLLFNLVCIEGAVLLSLKWLGNRSKAQKLFFATIIPTLMPGAVYSYLTGQITPLVNLAILFSAWIISSQSKVWLSAFGLLLVTLKPHIVVLPALICVLELARRKHWGVIAAASFGLLILLGLSTIWLPDWFPSLIEAWAQGNYRGGAPGLISPGYIGLRELGIPVWVFLPLAAYTLWRWWRAGLDPYVFALALSVNLLIVPYSRSYDLVVLILPLLYLTNLRSRRDLGVFVVSMISIFVLPLTELSILTPLLITILLLLKREPFPTMQQLPSAGA